MVGIRQFNETAEGYVKNPCPCGMSLQVWNWNSLEREDDQSEGLTTINTGLEYVGVRRSLCGLLRLDRVRPCSVIRFSMFLGISRRYCAKAENCSQTLRSTILAPGQQKKVTW